MRKNADDAITQVFEGLRDVDVPVGMEMRILDGLEERTLTRGRLIWWPIPVSNLARGVALAGVVIFALAIPAIRKLGHAPVQPKIAGTPVEAVSSVPFKVASEVAKRSSRELDVRQMRGEKAHETELIRTSDSVALSASFAPSLLAPPMPLTEQEKLLLRIAHKSAPVELAMLDLKLEATQDMEEKEEFQRFFERPTTKHARTNGSTEPATSGQSATEQPSLQQSTMEQEAASEQPPTDQSTPEQSTTEQLAPKD